jgi:hypothetical protein
MRIDAKKILRASLLLIAISVALVFSIVILRLLPVLVTEEADMLNLISDVYSGFLYIGFLALFFWGGIRATKKFNLDAIGAGVVCALSYLVAGFTHLLLDMLLGLLFASHVIAGTFVSSPAVLAGAIFGTAAEGGAGIALSMLCGVGMISLGTLINFVVGGAGSIAAQR